MKFLKILLLVVLNIVLVLKINCIPISEDEEVIGYLQNFGYLTDNEKSSLNQIVDDYESLRSDIRVKRALKNLQRNGNIPITGKYDESTSALIKTPRCGVSDETANKKRHKRYSLMSSKWQKTNITYRFNHLNKEQFIENEDKIRRILRDAFNVWEKDTVLTFTESKADEAADIMISFQPTQHLNIDHHIFKSMDFGHAFRPGKGLGGDIHLNELSSYDFDVSNHSNPTEGKVSLYPIILHLIGHSLGLEHSRDTEAIMYEFYSKKVTTLGEDDIRGMHAIYGVPPNRKNISKQQEDSEEELPVWGEALHLPNKCNTSYDAIAMIDDEVIAFKGKFMFSLTMDLHEIRSRWRKLSPRMKHVDAVYQTIDNKTLFFIGQAIYSFIGNKLEKMMKLSDLGIDPSVLKIDAIFRRPDNQRTYIFIGNLYHRFDELKMAVTGYSNRISKAFKDVFNMETAFTYKDNVTYFFKNEYYYKFLDKSWTLQRMMPELSGNSFMNCSLENLRKMKAKKIDSELDYIDGIIEPDYEPDCDNPEIDLCGSHSAASVRKFTFAFFVLLVPIIYGY
ncbi:stromelysin-1-like [Chironomus tepperi]|uniref:stromelysin-1-like n=1 Tax=Chironomus tepperi TaxID=113505 RepID=UPI00391F4C14